MRAYSIASCVGVLFAFTCADSFAQDAPPAAQGKPPVNQEAAEAQIAATPVTGSKTAVADNFCASCHTEEALWDQQNKRLFVPQTVLAHDVHYQKGVTCSDCHGGKSDSSRVNDAHARENGFRASLAEIQPACAHCHVAETKKLTEGLHSCAGQKNPQGVAVRWLAPSATAQLGTAFARRPIPSRRCS